MFRLRPKPIQLQPFFGHRSQTRLRLAARALRQRERGFEVSGRLRAIGLLLGQFASHEVPGLNVRLSFQGPDRVANQTDAITDSEGFVWFDIPLDPSWEFPKHPAWETVHLAWSDRGHRATTTAHILAPGRDGRLAVISDIDDTIIETGITGGWRSLAKNWRRIVAQLPGERDIVPGALPFYGMLGGGEVPSEVEADDYTHDDGTPKLARIAATHRPFFYVSSSPWNLFAYLVAYQRAKGLPLGPMMLRDWSFDRATLGKASHAAHKRDAIASILAMHPELRFALIGDDTQGDLPAFAGAVAAYPGRVAAVFVRTVGKPFSAQEEQAISVIRAAEVPLWLGESFATGEAFLRTLGFTPGGETEQIVKAVEKVDNGMPTAAQ